MLRGAGTYSFSIALVSADLDKWDEYVKPDSARIAGTCDHVESPVASESSDESADYSDSSSDE
jgi:hypothetical protein